MYRSMIYMSVGTRGDPEQLTSSSADKTVCHPAYTCRMHGPDGIMTEDDGRYCVYHEERAMAVISEFSRLEAYLRYLRLYIVYICISMAILYFGVTSCDNNIRPSMRADERVSHLCCPRPGQWTFPTKSKETRFGVPHRSSKRWPGGIATTI